MAQTTTRATIRQRASAELRLRYQGKITQVDTVALTIPAIGDRFSLATAPLAAYTWPHESTPNFDNFRRIVDFNPTTGIVTVNRAHTGSINDLDCSVFLILTPSDWNECIDAGIQALYVVEQIEITPVEGQSLYSLPTGKEWVQSRQQIQRLWFKFTPTNSPEYHRDVPVYKLLPSANTMQILIELMPDEDVSQYKIVVEARHHYQALSTDAATTTCPQDLAVCATKLEALRRIWSILGEREAKTLFGADMAATERQYVDLSRDYVEQVVHTPIHTEKAPPGPEMAVTQNFGRW